MAAMVQVMPKFGDTSVKAVNGALAPLGMELVSVTVEYSKRGGIEFHVLQERRCALVIHVKLVDLEGDEVSHFVGYDGKTIHDQPHVCKVNDTTDRTDWAQSKLAFAKLFPKTEYTSWQTTAVYRLCQ